MLTTALIAYALGAATVYFWPTIVGWFSKLSSKPPTGP